MKPITFALAGTKVALALTVSLAAAAGPAGAQADRYPSKPVRIIAGVAPGGGIDISARLAGEKLSERLGQPVVIENRTGAGGRIAAEYVAKQSPDGYTLLAGGTSQITVAPAIYPNLPYSPLRNFVPISMLMSTAFVLIVPVSHPAKTVHDLVAWAKANPDKANYATSTTTTTLAMELLKVKTGMPGVMVPYKASSESVVSIIGGQTQFAITDLLATTPAAKSGQVRALAVTGKERTPELPDVPTLAEAGVPMAVPAFVALLAPAGTPPAIVKRLESEVAHYAQLPDVRARLAALSASPVATTSEELARMIEAEIKLYTEVVKAANLKFAD
jgi:tripartite-type tricarboxylate transporter receptor subunit TctC